MNRKDNKHTKRLTTQSHYRASIVLHELEQGIIPDWVTWEVKEQHLEILKMFVIEGMNSHEIERSNRIYSRFGKPMSADMILLWVNRYLPFVEYDEKPNVSPRGQDKHDRKEYENAKKLLPKEKCAICGSAKDLELDHIVTYYAGGRSEPSNLQWLCHKCHKKKTAQEQKAFNWY